MIRVAPGSSPLARGLLRKITPVRVLEGIIPARAGFTCHIQGQLEIVRDHPRSRGVYSVSSSLMVTGQGSSPLARGLRILPHLEGVGVRIIPARAGFTGVKYGTLVSARDHPRSRGVYDMMVVTELQELGSSPLARGLRRVRHVSRAGRRIIPARAGFTAHSGEPAGPRQDHPRSRGVYSICSGATAARNGSSPLARGLPHVIVGAGRQ